MFHFYIFFIVVAKTHKNHQYKPYHNLKDQINKVFDEMPQPEKKKQLKINK